MPPFTYKGTTIHTASEKKIDRNMKSKTNNSLLIYKKIIKLNTEELSAKSDKVNTTVAFCFSSLHRLFEMKTFRIMIWPRQATFQAVPK